MLNKRSWLRANSMLLMCVSLILGMRPALSQQEVNMSPIISETVVMLYYKDITAASAFFGETLGLEMTFSQDTAKLFRLTPTSVVGVILEGDTSYHKVQASNAVMLSIVTPDVDAWYDRLMKVEGIKFLKPIADSSTNPIRAFLIEDPGGYTIEFFSWKKVVDTEASN
jgi:predicted enzyme related to lactoylglutathione lyase